VKKTVNRRTFLCT